jgi:2-hydroxychromene-2-carboxylate isomerase
MTVKVDFIFDFASPNAYLSYKTLHDIVARTGAELNIIPCLLGGIFKTTGNQAPMVAFAGVKGKMAYEMLETQRFIEKHQLDDFKMNEHFPVNTLLLMRGAIAAEQEGQLLEYIEAGLKAMWEQSLKMDDPEVFVTALTDAGLDGAKLLEQTQDPVVKAKLVANTEAAVQRGAFGIPTFYVGEEMFFGKDRLGQLEAEVLKANG